MFWRPCKGWDRREGGRMSKLFLWAIYRILHSYYPNVDVPEALFREMHKAAAENNDFFSGKRKGSLAKWSDDGEISIEVGLNLRKGDGWGDIVNYAKCNVTTAAQNAFGGDVWVDKSGLIVDAKKWLESGGTANALLSSVNRYLRSFCFPSILRAFAAQLCVQIGRQRKVSEREGDFTTSARETLSRQVGTFKCETMLPDFTTASN